MRSKLRTALSVQFSLHASSSTHLHSGLKLVYTLTELPVESHPCLVEQKNANTASTQTSGTHLTATHRDLHRVKPLFTMRLRIDCGIAPARPRGNVECADSVKKYLNTSPASVARGIRDLSSASQCFQDTDSGLQAPAGPHLAVRLS